MGEPFVSLVPIYLGPHQEIIPRLSEQLVWAYDLPVRIRPPWFDPERAFDASRGQYSSTTILEFLLGEPSPQGVKILGVTSVDLFVPALTYVFGEAQLQGRAAVISLHRLQSKLYGLQEDPQLLFERVEKEAVHELGHTYGLIHCQDAGCVMRSSTYVEEIDLKSRDFCPSCKNRTTLE